MSLSPARSGSRNTPSAGTVGRASRRAIHSPFPSRLARKEGGQTAPNRLGSCNAACGRYRRRHENG